MHRFIWIPICAFAACTTFESDPPPIDAIDAPTALPDAQLDGGISGPRHTYVVSRMVVPHNATEATQVGLDIDDRPNDGIDNQLGTLLASLGTLAPGLVANDDTNVAVDRGRVLILVDVRADDLTTDAGAGAFLHVGDLPQPPACTGPTDTVCRHHLDGNASFTLAPGVAPGTAMPGRLLAGHLVAGPGTFTLPFVFGDGAAVLLPIEQGRVELVITEPRLGVGSKLGGGIRQSAVDGLLIPALHAHLAALIAADCPPPNTGATCNCDAGSTGASVMGFLDVNDDCNVTVAEVRDTIDSILTDDLDLDGDGVNDAVSIGLGLEGVGATFAAP